MTRGVFDDAPVEAVRREVADFTAGGGPVERTGDRYAVPLAWQPRWEPGRLAAALAERDEAARLADTA